MDIQSSLFANLLPVKTVQTSLSQWVLGQTLSATVISRKSPDTVILEINNQRIEAKTSFDKPIQTGDQLKLVVEKNNSPTVLRVVINEPSARLHENRQQLLRLTIPKQTGIEKMPALLMQFSNHLKQATNILPTRIEQQIKKLMQNLPTKENITNSIALKTVINNSGLLLEAKLMSEVINKPKQTLVKDQHAKPLPFRLPQSISKDLKANLLLVSDTISKYKHDNLKTQTVQSSLPVSKLVIDKKTLKEAPISIREASAKLDFEMVSKQIESFVARIEVNQAKVVVSNENQLPIWLIETPVNDNPDIDLLKLEIQPDRTAKADNEKETTWTVNIKIDFENSGSISAKVSMLNKEISASLWSENKLLTSLIDENLNLLNKQIENTGLSINKLTCLDSCPVNHESLPKENLALDKLINVNV